MRPTTLLAVSAVLALSACGSNASTAPITTAPTASAVTTASKASNPVPAAGPTAGLPAISGGATAKPVIEIPKTDPPKELVVTVLSEGTGPEVTAGKQLTAHYVGQVWATGKQFDASWDRGDPATFPIGSGGLIPAWDKGLVGKKIGSRVLIVAPPASGYGSQGNARAGITGTDTLIFVVDLVKVG